VAACHRVGPLPTIATATRATQTTFSESQEKAEAGNTCFPQTSLRDVGGLRHHPLPTRWAEPGDALRGSQSLHVARAQHPALLRCSLQRHEEGRQRGASGSHVAKWVTWTRKDHSFFAERLLRGFLTQSAGCGSEAGVFRLIKNRGSCLSSHLGNLLLFFNNNNSR